MEPPLRMARRFASRELKEQATPEELRWLYDNALLWLRALTMIKNDVSNHIAKAKRDIEGLKPPAGTHASQDYLDAKHGVEEKNKARLHFSNIVGNRLEEVKSLISSLPASRLTLADIIEAFIGIADLIDIDDLDGASDKSVFWANKLAGKVVAE